MTDEHIRLIAKNCGRTFTIFPRASVWDPAFVVPVIEHNLDGTFTLYSGIDEIVSVLAEVRRCIDAITEGTQKMIDDCKG